MSTTNIERHSTDPVQPVTLRQFIRDHRISMSCEWADANPHMDDPSGDMSHYKCKLRAGRKTMTVYFSMGSAHTREPEAADVLDCLASDAAGIDNAMGFDEWCGDYGYDTDSRKAEKTYQTCKRQAEKLARLLGQGPYRTLLFDCERL